MNNEPLSVFLSVLRISRECLSRHKPLENVSYFFHDITLTWICQVVNEIYFNHKSDCYVVLNCLLALKTNQNARKSKEDLH